MMTAWLGAWLVCGMMIGAVTAKPDDGAAHWLVSITMGPAIYIAALLFKGPKP